MYVLTNIEAEATSKVLENLGPDAGHDLPEQDRKTLRDLAEKLSTAIDNGLPDDPAEIDNSLPSTDRPDQSLPGQPYTPDNELPPEPGAAPKTY